MKKISLLTSFITCVCIMLLPSVTLANSDGSLQLNTTVITNQSGDGSSGSEFDIRGQLFSQTLTKRIQERADQTVSCHQVIQKIDFNRTSQNALYQKDYQPLKTNLFKTYNQAYLPVAKVAQSSDTRPMFFLLVLALPLMILTAVMSKIWTRRKRRR
ncbi:MAG: type VII secretion protein EssA [Alkalibacterium sp.]|nr:type VII secretion protein EssA [Lactococcus plantarum]MDN6071038.1 type VII secretion protein EssA [Lactococcus plantarum]MDN6085164.1 type VII secretion protein EssA [Lactococcus plantarum]MDN6194727.1 type VII secretion protein EssA [Alkalibacterium sp.]